MEKLSGGAYTDYWVKRAQQQGPGYVGRHDQVHDATKIERQARDFWSALLLMLPTPQNLIATVGPEPIIVEFGAGWGRIVHRLAEHYPDARIIAVDMVPESVERGKILFPHIEFILGSDLSVVPHADLLVTCTCLQHVTDPEVWHRVRDSIHARVRAGGRIVLLENNKAGRKSPHMADRTKDDYERELFGFDFISTMRYGPNTLDKEPMVLMAGRRKTE
jgi:hypothetical protein